MIISIAYSECNRIPIPTNICKYLARVGACLDSQRADQIYLEDVVIKLYVGDLHKGQQDVGTRTYLRYSNVSIYLKLLVA